MKRRDCAAIGFRPAQLGFLQSQLTDERKILQMTHHAKWLLSVLVLAAGVSALSQETRPRNSDTVKAGPVVQIVALDECDPTTFNAALGPDFCKNVALAPLGFATTFQELFTKAAAGKPDPGWDFEPDTLTVKEG